MTFVETNTGTMYSTLEATQGQVLSLPQMLSPGGSI